MSSDRRSGRDGGGPPYCSNCGTGLEPSANYCPNCGSPNGGSSGHSRPGTGATRARRTTTGGVREGSSGRVTDRDVLEHRIATAARDGWKLEHDFGDHAVVVKRTFGSVDEHLVVALITIWFTGGIGNVLYGAYRYFGDVERMVLRTDYVEESGSDGETIGSAILWRATAAVCWLAAATVAAIALQFVGPTASLPLFALALVFAAMGVSALPSVRRRLENRHSLAANGRVRSVDEHTVVAYDRPCAACADPVGRGLERTYRKEFCVLGVPLTADEGRNYYCKRCATAESSATGPSEERPAETLSEPLADRGVESPESDREPEHA